VKIAGLNLNIELFSNYGIAHGTFHAEIAAIGPVIQPMSTNQEVTPNV
jgi:hypothetical protein